MTNAPVDALPARRFNLLVPGLVTSLGIALACVALLLSVDPAQRLLSVALVWLAIVLDHVDGPLARKLNAVSQTGAALDATGDLIMYLLVPCALLTHAGPVGWAAGLLWLLAGAWRVAIDTARQEKWPLVGFPALPLYAWIGLSGEPVTWWGALVLGVFAVVWMARAPSLPRWWRIPGFVVALGSLLGASWRLLAS